MPYLQKDKRPELDRHADEIIKLLLNNCKTTSQLSLSISYLFSRILWFLCGYNNSGAVDFPRMCMIYGVLEAIKLEFTRRIWEPYIKRKATFEGDIGYESIKLSLHRSNK